MRLFDSYTDCLNPTSDRLQNLGSSPALPLPQLSLPINGVMIVPTHRTVRTK